VRRRVRKGGGRQLELAVTQLGARGDGVASHQGRPVFLANALPGETVIARLTGERSGGFKGEVIELLQASRARVDAPCPHFGSCGGCSLQHLAPESYRTWKRDLLLTALARRGIAADSLEPLVEVPPRSRRRIALGARQSGEGVLLGFRAREGHRIVNLTDCLIVLPSLQRLLGPLREALAVLLDKNGEAEVILSALENGVDAHLVLERDPGLAGREALQAFAEGQDLARLTWRQRADPSEAFEPLAIRRQPFLTFGKVRVTPAPRGFIQPTAKGEALLRDFVLASLPDSCRRIAELFAGCGSFTFSLSERARVAAFEGDGLAIEALEAARNAHVLNDRVTASKRDLDRDPLSADELKKLSPDVLVFDPPRQGARAQSAEIAASGIPRVIGLSCNPSSFARDARLLLDGGYHLESLQPVDQFPWSGHLELAALFRKGEEG
jgi:23S rRNA (uracil1939-C5)-methyltransferase